MPKLTHGEAQDLLATFKKGWETRAPDVIMELFNADIDYRHDPFAEPLVGLIAVRALWNDIVATQVHVEFDAERIWVSGETALASWHAAYTHRQTAERVRARGFMTMEVGASGRVYRFRQWPLERVVGRDSTLSDSVLDAVGGTD